MATNPHPGAMTPEEYLAFERASTLKHEYHNGQVVALASKTLEHNTLAGNMAYLLKQSLGKGTPCRVYNSDTRVLISRRQYVYPDVVVSCDVYDHRHGNDILRSPHLVVEVLSPSTERVDRGQKLLWYQNSPTIQEYVLINTNIQLVELYRRTSGENWQYVTYTPGQTITLDCLDLRITVNDIYAETEIPTTEP